MPTKIRPFIKSVTEDRKVDAQEWDEKIRPNLDQRPKATAESREILKLWGNDKFEIDAGARDSMERYLRESGYPIPYDAGRPDKATLRDIMAGNVSETDRDFERLLKLTGRKDAETLIAVLDGGFELEHPALESKWWTNPKEIVGNEIDDDGNGLVDDIAGWDFVDNDSDLRGSSHGSHVSGIATRGGEHVKAIPVRTFSPLTAERLTAALEYACSNGAKVVNMSFKMDTKDQVDAARTLMAKYPDVLFVKSAGNDGERLDPSYAPYKPETYLPTNVIDNMVVVASCDGTGKRADSSNYGAPFATVAMRGTEVYSTVPGRSFEPMDGTSMASPNVAAVCARCLTLAPRLTASDLKKLLLETSDSREDWKELVLSGGLVNEKRAQQLAALIALTDGGMAPEAAADKLRLPDQESSRLIALLPGYTRES